ncbi:MAG: hypothetical protein FWE67_06735, partial [Planctomycetaceae bacterium]|nr:hypothetical protein [Planctomycetaceae bacterium]
MTQDQSNESVNRGRRELLGKIALGGAALTAGGTFISYEDEVLAQEMQKEVPKDVTLDALSGASRTHTNWAKFADLKKKMTTATIGGIEFSRMMMGGNLIGGWAHSRDLMYVSDLVKAYHTRDKIIATFKM